MKTLEFLQDQVKRNCETKANTYSTSVREIFFGDISEVFFQKNTLEVNFSGYVIFEDNINNKENLSVQFTCAYKTPKGYISSKKLPVKIQDIHNVTISEVTELLKFNTDAVENGFDPFWHENESKRRNAAAWNHVAKNHLQPDVNS